MSGQARDVRLIDLRHFLVTVEFFKILKFDKIKI